MRNSHKKIHCIISGFVQYIISCISYFIPTKKNTIIFASTPDFSDNSWALYLYLKENRPDLKLFWAISGKSTTPNCINKKNIIDTTKNKWMYVWKINRARALFSTHGIKFPKIKQKNQIIINLTHGASPIKKNKGTDIPLNCPNNFKLKIPYDYIICRGEGSIAPTAIFQFCDESKILPLGMIRDDIFIKNIGEGSKNPFYNGHSCKLILWMPTFRISKDPDLSEINSANETGLPLFNNEHELIIFNDYLASIDIQILVKIHPLQTDYPIFNKNFSNITFITNKSIADLDKQPYEVFGYSDALITDYSSIYFDYLITDKPVGFILNDIEEYNKDRGFILKDPTTIMAGHHLYNIRQLYSFIDDVLNGKDEYKDKRKEIRDLYVGDIPESTAKRFVEYFNI